jgi:uncharacterized protein YbaP (TraB family)
MLRMMIRMPGNAWHRKRMARFLRRIVALTLSLLFAASLAHADAQQAACPPEAQAPTPEQAQSAMRSARDRGFLWRIRKGGRSSWLYGTLHVGKLDWMFPGATVMRALAGSERIALELDVLDEAVAQRLSEAVRAGSDEVLPEPLSQRLRAQAERACMPALGVLAPELQALTLSIMSARVDELDPSYAIDPFFAGLARQLHKPVVSLETPEAQVELLRSASAQERQATIEKTLDELESGRARAMIRRIADVWANGRLDELQRYEQWCDCAQSDADRRLLRRLLDERNVGLAERIAALHEGGHTVFAAVGSLHMIGAAGLPALLAQRGYEVERIEFPR